MTAYKKKISLNCMNCGNEYLRLPSRVSGSRYCSNTCMKEHKAVERKELTCCRCGEKFTAAQDHGVWPKYCSRECFIAGAPKPVEKECPSCNSIFIATRSSHETSDGLRVYCSDKCRNDGLRKPNEFTCECCGVVFVRSDSMVNRDRFCSRKCVAKMMRREQGSSWKGGKYKDETTNCIRVLLRSREGVKREFYTGEHRIIASKAIGRVLYRHELILHINQKKDDNRLENLFICAGMQELRMRYDGRLPWPNSGNLTTYERKKESL